jgi:hypothetical protein
MPTIKPPIMAAFGHPSGANLMLRLAQGCSDIALWLSGAGHQEFADARATPTDLAA